MLGDIVHNEDVVRDLANAGIKKVKHFIHGKDKTFLIRAHGAGLTTIKKARKLGYKIADATCPMVKEIHTIARQAEEKGYTVIIIGDKKHDEVQGIIGQLKQKALVIENHYNIPWGKIKKNKKACVVVQSTQNLEKVMAIINALKTHIKELKFVNTICNPTKTKQEEIKKMPLENDIMIIIGSKNSANTRRLYEIAKSLNNRSYWVQSKADIKHFWFKEIKKVGITAGASTPGSTTQEVINHIKHLQYLRK